MKPVTFLDLFAGIGGLSLGFEMAGATPLAAVESNKRHANDYARNHAESVRVFNESITDIGSRELARELGIVGGDLDLIVGGPPCQPFSTAGKRNGTADLRGTLIDEFVRFVIDLAPKAFVMENVVGLRSIHGGAYLRRILRRVERSGFRCTTFILDAADYGVPQCRRRLFVVGSRIDGVDLTPPLPTHGPKAGPLLGSPHVTVRDAISDLPRVSTADHHIDDETLLPYVGPPNAYQRELREGRRRVTGNGITLHWPHILAAISRDALPEGAIHPSTRYRRLRWNTPSVTLRAGSGTFTALRPIHPEEPRVITVREAARLQSFPDRFQFAPEKKNAYQQIGNSVPPLLARAIGRHIISSLTNARARA